MTATREPEAPDIDPPGGVALAPEPGWELDATDPTPERPGRPARGRRPGGSWAGLRPLVLRLHFYAGILVAPFLAVAAVTGLLFAFTPQLDSMLYGQQLHAASGSGPVLPLDQQVAAARAAHPEGSIAAVHPAATAGATTWVVLTVPGLPAEDQRTVYVDPHTGAIRGSLTTWFDETPTTTWLDSLHRTLHLGTVGRVYSELAASWLWVITLGGVLLWYGRRRRRRRHLLVADLAARGRRRTLGWHGPTGLWLTIALLFLSATGLTWSHYAGAHFSTLLDKLNARAPVVSTDLPGAAPATGADTGGAHAGHHAAAAASTDTTGYDRAETAARGAGLQGPLSVTPAAEPGQAWTVAETDQRWPIHLDSVAIDPATGTVTDSVRFADFSVLATLSKLGVLAHMGVLFGLLNQLVLAAVAIGLLCVLIWGYRMWWQRRPTRTNGAPARPVGPAPAPGAWRRANKPLLAALILAAIAIGWALPVLGVSLAAFLLIDVIRSRISTRRTGRPPAASPAAPAAAVPAAAAEPG
jgi:uncharacterized iron-regulated membrane protein